MSLKGKPTLRGAKALMMTCTKCGKSVRKIIMGQKLCNDCSFKGRDKGES